MYEEQKGEAVQGPPPRRGGRLLLLGILVFLAGLGAARLLPLPAIPPADREGAIREELAALAEAIGDVSARVQALSEELRTQIGDLKEEIAALHQEMEQLQESQRAEEAPDDRKPLEISVDDDPALGEEDAPVVIIEFSDFQCPFCKRFAEQTFPQLKRDYIDTGKVRFVFRDFPILRIHPNAGLAALAAECADEQGRFWEMHDRLFARQAEWAGIAPEQARSLFEAYARELKLDDPAFSECLASERYAEEVVEDWQDGIEAGVRGTPAFFINGEKLEGAWPYEKFREVIERALAASD